MDNDSICFVVEDLLKALLIDLYHQQRRQQNFGHHYSKIENGASVHQCFLFNISQTFLTNLI